MNGSTKLADIFKQKYSSIVFLNYFPQLEKFLLWYQQLLAESLGKRAEDFYLQVSTVPKDHHSLLQLYLDGQKIKYFSYLAEMKKILQNCILII